jgi:ribosome maturation factor RimP
MSDSAPVQRVRALVTPIVRDLHLDLYDLEFRGGILRVTIDTPPGSEGGVNLESIALATRLISRELDHEDPMPGHYTLEVSSPGLERQLRVPAHFQREIGKTVNIRLRDTTSANRRVHGVLVAASDHDCTVRLEDPAVDGTFPERVVPYDQIDRAKTVFVWGPTPKPSTAPKKPGTSPSKAAGPGTTLTGSGKTSTKKEAS